MPEPPRPTRLHLLSRQFRNALVLLLVAATVISIVIGELVDALIILAIVIANAALGFVQEGRAEDASRRVRELLTPNARVMRDGRVTEIDTGCVVRGDVALLRAGDRVPADGRLIEAVRLEIDESSLTGESLPAPKRATTQLEDGLPEGERPGEAFAGTTVTHGSGRMLVAATGPRTELSRIAAAAAATPHVATPLQQRLDRLAAVLLQVAGVVCLGLAGLSWLYGENLEIALLTGVSLAVAAVPEGLPAVVTVCLAIGMRRMAERGAIVRRLQAVETLGSTTVICSDKTGTLTENRMQLVRLYLTDRDQDVSYAPGPAEDAAVARLLGAAVLACEAEIVQPGDQAAGADPTERAILEAAAGRGLVRSALLEGGRIERREPFDPDRKLSSLVVRRPDDRLTAYAMGAPESMIQRLAPRAGAAAERLDDTAARWASRGVRVLLVASRDGLGHDDDAETCLEPLGLLGLADPPRPGSRPSVLEARRAGVRTVMITGDHPQTALAIARETAVVPESDASVITGRELDRLDDLALAERIDHVGVYARVVPQHKVRIVQALVDRGDVVAMTGDGVNDVPALRAAHIGIAMGRGTDAAAAAADMILTDDNYETIVHAIRRGRAIHDNIQHFLLFLLSANAGEVLVFAVAVTLGLSAPLTVAQILLVNLLTDGLPAVALGVDPPHPGVMRRGPRPLREGLLGSIAGPLAAGGTAVGAAAFAAFAVGHSQSQEAGQTMAFTTLVFGQLVLAFAARGPDWFFRAARNRALWGAVLLSGAVQVLVLAVPAVADQFGLVALSARQLAFALVLAFVPFATLEAYKAWRRSR